MAKRTLDQISFKGRKVLVRVDFNVPLEGEPPLMKVVDDTRIQAAIPTIKKILEDGGKPILMTHLGRPKSPSDKHFSLAPIAQRLAETLKVPVVFIKDILSEHALEEVEEAAFGKVILLENTRFYEGETKNDASFSEALARLGDIYINDAFGTAHRAHASTEGVTHYIDICGIGYLMQQELEALGEAIDNAEKPFIAILGGAKVSDKIGVIEALLPKVDALLIGGGMSFTLLKAQGHNIGNSLVEEDKLSMASELLNRAAGKIHLPTDHVIADTFSNEAATNIVENEIPNGWMGLDIGPETIASFSKIIEGAKTIIWNGPLGVFEMSSFQKGTFAIAKALAHATSIGATTIVGGGDSVAAIGKSGFEDSISHISTGGGAMLEFLEGLPLPGVEALDEV